MGRPKSNIESESVGVRMTAPLLQCIDAYAKERGLSRSKVVSDAALFYLSAKECVHCGILNSPYGDVCSCCKTMLFEKFEILDALVSVVRPENSKHESIKTVLQVMNLYEKKYGKIGCNISIYPVIDRTKNPTEYRVKLHLVLEDGKTKLLPDDNLDLVDKGVVIPKEVLLEELMRNADRQTERRKDLRDVERFLLGNASKLLDDEEEKKD